MLTLFTNLRRAEIDPRRRKIRLRRRFLYVFTHSEEIDFGGVSYVDYSYGAIVPAWGWITLYLSEAAIVDVLEEFTVAVVTRDGQRHPICVFRGETAACAALPAEDGLPHLSGTQEPESRQFVDELSTVLGVPIGKTFPEIREMATCPACGQRTSLRDPRCLYCGAQVDAATEQGAAPDASLRDRGGAL